MSKKNYLTANAKTSIVLGLLRGEYIETFIEDYNNEWMLHRLNYYSPVEARKKYQAESQLEAA